jgi:arabinose-5-phosphate isomerase
MSKILTIAKDVINIEIEGLTYMAAGLDSEFEDAVQAIISTNGRTIICGMGKSGIIGKKIVASLASTGTPSFFMHPGEAFHGHLGMVKPEHEFVAISNSGETEEVLRLIPFLRNSGNIIIAMTGKKDSTLVKNAHIHLNVSVPKEACPLQLAPTTSTTAALVMGDALTVALMSERDFKQENFAKFHPGGSLGKRLLGRVSDEMMSEFLPVVKPQDKFFDVINCITNGKLGLAIIENVGDVELAIITDGDLRRAMVSQGKAAFDLCADDIASRKPFIIGPNVRLQRAYEYMELQKVSDLIVFEDNRLIGILKK